MRLFNIWGCWLDLDHVLCVQGPEFSHPGPYALITFAFQDKPKQVFFPPQRRYALCRSSSVNGKYAGLEFQLADGSWVYELDYDNTSDDQKMIMVQAKADIDVLLKAWEGKKDETLPSPPVQ